MNDTRIELEAVFRCPSCNGTPYRLYRRNTEKNPDVFTHVLWPTDPSIPPPSNTYTLCCPNDESPLMRERA